MVAVVTDADTLFGGTTCGLLIHLDDQGLIRLHWSSLILDEMSRALVQTGRKADQAAAARHEALMRAALPQAEVPTAAVQSQFEAVAWAMRSAKDIHVAAFAHVLRAQHYYPDAPVVSLAASLALEYCLGPSGLDQLVSQIDVAALLALEQAYGPIPSLPQFAPLVRERRSAPPTVLAMADHPGWFMRLSANAASRPRAPAARTAIPADAVTRNYA